MADRNKKVLAGLFAIAVFIVLIFYLPQFFEKNVPLICIDDGVCQHETYLESLITYIPAFIVLGFLFGVVVSFFYFERKLEVPLPEANRKQILLSLLQPAERKVLEKVVEKGGEALQSEISRVEGVGKVKAHRVIEKLVRRGVLEKEQMGKTNILRLRKDIKDAIK
ncbi:hypothetical protein KKB44_05310 [Candidatus Micrarchaeota archaeon]|nr:hypothetical protein [Candidatus Micrarchaeota archaeon]